MCGFTGRIDIPELQTVQLRRGVVDGRLYMAPVHAKRRIDDTAG